MSNQEKMGVTIQTNNLNQLLHACNVTGRSVGCPGVKGCLLADVIIVLHYKHPEFNNPDLPPRGHH